MAASLSVMDQALPLVTLLPRGGTSDGRRQGLWRKHEPPPHRRCPDTGEQGQPALNSDDIRMPRRGLIGFSCLRTRDGVDGPHSPVPALSPDDAAAAILQAVLPRPLSRAELEGYTRCLRNVRASRWWRPSREQRATLWAFGRRQFARDWRSCPGRLQENLRSEPREAPQRPWHMAPRR